MEKSDEKNQAYPFKLKKCDIPYSKKVENYFESENDDSLKEKEAKAAIRDNKLMAAMKTLGWTEEWAEATKEYDKYYE